MTQQFIQKFAMLDPVGYHLIYRPWMHIAEYNEACEWIKQFRWEDAHWDFGSGYGGSNINGVQYPNKIFFEHDADLLMFKLKFPNLLKF
jgi:hypothetical protein